MIEFVSGLITTYTVKALLQGRRSRGAGGFSPQPPLTFSEKNGDLIREESLQSPHFKSANPTPIPRPPAPQVRCSAIPVLTF